MISRATRGSADQKPLYFVATIKRGDDRPTVVVPLGTGFGRGAVDWLCAQVDGEQLFAVTAIDQFEPLFRRPLAGWRCELRRRVADRRE